MDISGLWWTPKEPEKKHYGRFRYDGKKDLSLSMHGSFGDVYRRTDTIPLIFGETDSKKNDGQVTLANCFTNRSSQTQRPGDFGERSEIFVHHAYIGGHINPSETRFTSATFRFSGLDEWAIEHTGFKRNTTLFTREWKSPDAVTTTIPQGEIKLGISCSTGGSARKQCIEESLGFVFTPREGMLDGEIHTAVAYPLQNFVTFATGTPNSLTKSLLSLGEGALDEVESIGARIYANDNYEENKSSANMLFTIGDLERPGETIAKWIELAKTYHSAFTYYFSNIYRDPGYTDTRLFFLLQTLSVYCNVKRDKPIYDGTFVGQAPVMADRYGFSFAEILNADPILNAANALDEIVDGLFSQFAMILRTPAGSGKDAFVRYALNSLYHITTGRVDREPFASGQETYWLAERVAMLFKLTMLKELLLADEMVKKIVMRNRMYGALASGIVR